MSSGIPAQVLRAAKEAEELYQAEIDASMGNTGPTGEVSEEISAIGPTGEVEEVVETLEQKLEKAEHRYEVLKGKYNKEVPDLATRLNDQSTLIRNLQDQLALIRKPVEESVKAKSLLEEVAEDPNVKYLKDEYPEVYKGLEAVAKKIEESANTKIKALTDQFEEEKTHTKKTDSERFYEDLDKVDGWRDINRSDEFNNYLDEIEPLTGFKRRSILTDAYTSLDSSRVKSFFTDFAVRTPRANNVDEVVVDTVKKEKGISPNTVSVKKIVDRSNKKENFIKASEITKFRDDVRRGVYTGRQKEQDAEDARLTLAVSEQRVLLGQ
jgi:hypothetical protein